MSFLAFTGLINTLTCIVLGFFVLIKHPKSLQNLSYFILNATVALYSLGYFFWQLSIDVTPATFWFKVLVTGFILLNSAYLFFVFVFLNMIKERWRILIGSLIINIFFVCLNLSDMFYRNLSPRFGLGFWPTPTIFFNVYLFVWFSQCFYGFYWLLVGQSLSSGRRKEQIKYFTLSAVVGFFGGATNWPMWYGINLPPYLNILISLYIAIVAYAIIRHNLMDIEVIVKKTAVFAGLFIFVYGVFTVVTILGQELFRNTLGWNQWFAMVPTVIVIIFATKPLETVLTNVTEKFLFQKKYDYKQILQAFIDEVITELNLENIVKGTEDLLAKTLHPKSFEIFLLNREGSQFASYRTGAFALKLDAGLAAELKRKKEIVSIEDGGSDPSKNTGLVAEIKQFGAVIAVPLVLQNELSGFMLLGAKKSDESYSKEDFEVLMDLAKTEAVAIKNARFVEELNLAQAELLRAETMKQVASMADGLSHQFNNRFQAISTPLGLLNFMITKTMAELPSASSEEKLKKMEDVLAKIKDGVSKASANAVRGGEIAKGLLKYSRPEKAGYQMQDIAKALNLGLELLEYKHADFSQIEIKKDIAQDLPQTWANMSYLQDMYQIVIDNAYDAIKQRLEDEPGLKGTVGVRISANQLKNLILIEVQDNGMGMRPDILEKVRNAVPYVTTKASSSEKSGYGAGVQVLRRLVGFHDGRLDYESNWGQGTKTIIEIPVKLQPIDTEARL